MKRRICLLSAVTALFVTLLCGYSINREAKSLSDKLIRLHVVANSDTDTDQSLKLKVRDAVLSELEVLLEGVSDKEEAKVIIEESFEKLKECCEDEIEKNGYDYSVSVSLQPEEFPTTEYETFSLPAGVYTSLRIKIGAGDGHNWWCVVFPPVCSSGKLDTEAAAAIGLSEEELSLITSETGGFVVKFRIMELIAKIKSLWQ